MMRELILYATPTGALADRCAEYFEAANRIGPTAAQTYPPHCTLTGFFHVSSARGDLVIEAMSQIIADAGPVPPDRVEIRRLGIEPDWVGLELGSDWFIELTSRVVARHRVAPGEDALRPKTWLHLSLAYGIPDLAAHAALATELFGTPVDAGWEVAVWERTAAQAWSAH